MKLQRLLSLTRQAVDHYQMIEKGDHIAVGISGGKDSLTLLMALGHLRKFPCRPSPWIWVLSRFTRTPSVSSVSSCPFPTP